MKALVFFLVVLALGTANPIDPTMTYTEPSLDELVRSAIDRNVDWLLSGIRNGTLEGPDLPRAVVALFLAEPGFFSPGRKIGQVLRDKITTALTELIRQAKIQMEAPSTRQLLRTQRNRAPSFIPSEDLGLFLQALLVSCVDPYSFLGYDLTDELWKSIFRYHCKPGECSLPSSAMLALCNARATSKSDLFDFITKVFESYGIRFYNHLTDEEAFLTMTLGCFESSNYPYPKNITMDLRLRHPDGWISTTGYRHYPSNLTVEDFQELMQPDGDPMGNNSSLSAIAADMQNLMYNHSFQVSDLSLGVDFLLKSQDEDGSWGQSALNSLFVLPVLSNKNFLDINSDHCPEKSENETVVEERKVVIYFMDGVENTWMYFHFNQSATLYDALKEKDYKTYQNGTDGKPCFHSVSRMEHDKTGAYLGVSRKENNPETGFFWFTYEHTKWPKESLNLLTQSHIDVKLKPSSKYLMWYRRKSEEETQNDQNEIQADFQIEN